MTRTLFFLFALTLSIFIGLKIQLEPGYVLVALGDWTLETTLWFAVFSLLALFFLMCVLLTLIRRISQLGYRFKKFSFQRQRLHGRTLTRQGLIEFTEGNWAQAERKLLKAISFSDVPLINYLAAARAAQEQGATKRRDKYLREAHIAMPDAKVAIELTQAQLQLTNQQWEQALATLNHLHSLVPKHPYVVKLLTKLHVELQDWARLNELLPTVKRLKILSDADYFQLELAVYEGLLTQMTHKKDLQAINNLWMSLPKACRQTPTLVKHYAQCLLSLKADTDAERGLRAALKKQWQPSLISLYGQCLGADGEKQLKFAESFLKQHPQNTDLLQCIASLSLREKLWGKARTKLEKILELKPSQPAYLMLAQLLEQLGEPLEAQHYYKQGLLLQRSALTESLAQPVSAPLKELNLAL